MKYDEFLLWVEAKPYRVRLFALFVGLPVISTVGLVAVCFDIIAGGHTLRSGFKDYVDGLLEQVHLVKRGRLDGYR